MENRLCAKIIPFKCHTIFNMLQQDIHILVNFQGLRKTQAIALAHALLQNLH